MRPFVPALLALLAACVPAAAQGLQLTGTQRWVVVASRQNIDEAIGVARTYEGAKVVRSVNGWYGIVTGPRAVASEAAVKKALIGNEQYPKDIVFSKGDNYIAIVWQQTRAAPLASIALEGEPGTKRLEHDGLTVTLTTAKTKDGEHVPKAVGMIGGRTVFTVLLEEAASEAPRASVELHRLDAASPQPTVVVTGYSGGAHCCTLTAFVSADAGGTWRTATGRSLDGGGYAIEDADGDGTLELTHRDNSFLYTFSSYAGSVAPTRIVRLNGRALADVTREPRYQPYLRQEIAGIEHAAQRYGMQEPNGYLAGWVAAKALVGEVEPAWAEMLRRQDRDPPVKPEKCLVNLPLDKCPPDKLKAIGFAEALRAHLVANGYPVPK